MNVTLPVFPLALSAGELMLMAPPVQTVLHSCLIYDLSRLAGRLLYCCLFTFPGWVNDDFFFVRSKRLISFWFFLLCVLMPYFVWAKTSAFGFVICKWFLVDLWAQQVDSRNCGHYWASHTPAVKMLCCISEPEINYNSWWAFIITFWMCMSGVFCLLHHHLSIPHCLGGDCREDLLEVLLHWDHWRCHYRGDVTCWEVFSLFPCKGLGDIFLGNGWTFYKQYLGFSSLLRKACFGEFQRLSPPEQELELKCAWKGFPPKRLCTNAQMSWLLSSSFRSGWAK